MLKFKDLMERINETRSLNLEEVESIDELSVNTVRGYYNKAGEQGKKISDKMKMGGGDWSKDGSDTKTLKKRAAGRTMALKRRSGEVKMSEDAEQVAEGQKPYVSSESGGIGRSAAAHVLDSKGKIVKSFHKKEHGAGYMKKASDYLEKNYNKMKKEEVEQTDEALKGSQHKIDANKNGKVDGHDFKILRNAKKARYQ